MTLTDHLNGPEPPIKLRVIPTLWEREAAEHIRKLLESAPANVTRMPTREYVDSRMAAEAWLAAYDTAIDHR